MPKETCPVCNSQLLYVEEFKVSKVYPLDPITGLKSEECGSDETLENQYIACSNETCDYATDIEEEE